jgi:hypothetical protein
MSKEDHLNFQAANFVAKVTKAFYESLRGNADKHRVDDEKLYELVIKTTVKAERLADRSARSPVTFDNPIENIDDSDRVQ